MRFGDYPAPAVRRTVALGDTLPKPRAKRSPVAFKSMPPRIQAQLLECDNRMGHLMIGEMRERLHRAQTSGNRTLARKLEFELRDFVNRFNEISARATPFIQKHLNRPSWDGTYKLTSY